MDSKTNQFKAEIAEMLDLVVNSLYSKKEIFLRELVSNASDAIDRAKYLGLTEKDLVADNPEWAIEIAVDKTAKTMMVSDNGIGMDAEDMEKNLGTIASSGTKAFRQALKEKGGDALPELIGQFGVGFYAAFMVADKVRVVSKKRGTSSAFMWESSMDGSYTISDATREAFGTSIMLHFRDDQAEYLDYWRVSELIKKYSDFIGGDEEGGVDKQVGHLHLDASGIIYDGSNTSHASRCDLVREDKTGVGHRIDGQTQSYQYEVADFKIDVLHIFLVESLMWIVIFYCITNFTLNFKL